MDEHRQDISELTLKPSSGGVFEVTLNDTLMFSKKSLKRHAQPDEIEQAIREFRLKA
ncbi:MAG: Rdx family protein [Herpetosiphon sp.]|nr:Rdx family protein [Herpetosiphon sp.]